MLRQKKTLVLYIFHIFNERVQYFIDNAIFEDNNVDFIIISNNTRVNIKSKIPSYVKVVYRCNIGYDFGGWSETLIKSNLYKKYDNFILCNSSIMGPFISKDIKVRWTDLYLNNLKNNVKLFGSTINTMLDPINKSHVQSYIFCMDKETLEYLINCEIFSMTNYASTFAEAIKTEILMSRKIIENGWNIGSFFKHYNGVDFTFKSKTPSEYNIVFYEDIMYQKYYNKLWNKNELVFIKGNRIMI